MSRPAKIQRKQKQRRVKRSERTREGGGGPPVAVSAVVPAAVTAASASAGAGAASEAAAARGAAREVGVEVDEEVVFDVGRRLLGVALVLLFIVLVLLVLLAPAVNICGVFEGTEGLILGEVLLEDLQDVAVVARLQRHGRVGL